MAIKTKEVLKTYFNTGDKPTESQFADLIDSMAHVSQGVNIISDDDFEVSIRDIVGNKTLFAGQKVPPLPENFENMTEEQQNEYFNEIAGKGVLFFQKFQDNVEIQQPVLDENNQPVLDENNNPTYQTITETKDFLLIVLGNYFNGLKIIKNITDNTYRYFLHGLPDITNLEELEQNAKVIIKKENDELLNFPLEYFVHIFQHTQPYHRNIESIINSDINSNNSSQHIVPFKLSLGIGQWTTEIILTTTGWSSTQIDKLGGIKLIMNNGNDTKEWNIMPYLSETERQVVILVTDFVFDRSTATSFSVEFNFDKGNGEINPQDFGGVAINLHVLRKDINALLSY